MRACSVCCVFLCAVCFYVLYDVCCALLCCLLCSAVLCCALLCWAVFTEGQGESYLIFVGILDDQVRVHGAVDSEHPREQRHAHHHHHRDVVWVQDGEVIPYKQ